MAYVRTSTIEINNNSFYIAIPLRTCEKAKPIKVGISSFNNHLN